MAKYGWNLDELKSNLSLLQKILKIETDTDKISVLNDCIETYCEMISLIDEDSNLTVKDNENPLDDTLKYDSFEDLKQEQIESYQYCNHTIINTILSSFATLNDVYHSDFILNGNLYNHSDEELVLVTRNFINKMVPDCFKKQFFDALQSYNNIHFDSSKNINTYSGMTYFEPIFKRKDIFVSKSGLLIDLAILPHEIFHYFFNDTNVCVVNNYNTYYTTEFEGCFANLLFGDYIYNNATELNNYFNSYFLDQFYDDMLKLFMRNCFIQSIRENGSFRLNKFNKCLEGYNILPFDDKNEIGEFLNSPLEMDIKYTLGYLVAFDLYYIYKKDPEFAFYLLKNIRFMKHENDILGLLRNNHITFMDDGYENLKKYVKKIERQN